MPPLRQLPAEITSLTNEELMEQLLQYGFRPGPILPSTRVVYERKLFKLQTGQEVVSSTSFEPVDDDDDEDDQDSADEEVILQQQQPRQRMTRSTKPEVTRSTKPEVTRSTKPEVPRTPPRQPVAARQAQKHSAANRSQSAQSSQMEKETAITSRGWFSFSMKLLTVLIVAVLVFLVVKNMESDPASEVPDIPDHLEINV